MAKKLALSLAALAASALVVLAAGELVVRVAYGRDMVMFPRYHTGARYGEYLLRTIRPHATFHHTSRDGTWEFVTNGRGFRDTREFAYDKPPGTVRVLALGDSHTQGYEARQDHVFSAVLERYLRHRGVQAEVLNTGVSGFGTAEELLFLEAEGARYHPDYVVLALYANDYMDNVKSGLFGLDARGGLQISKKEHVPGVKAQDALYTVPGVRWLGEHSYLYSLVFNGVWQLFKNRLAHDRAVEYAVAETGDVGEYETRLMAALLQRMSRFCHANGMQLIVVDVPALSDTEPFESSVVPALRDTVRASSDVYLDSAATLSELAGVVEIHVPHGHRHISEFTHLALGTALGRTIEDDLRRHPRPASAAAPRAATAP
jgi:hypothetical protein